MERIRAWVKEIDDINLSLQERMFRLLTSVSLTILLVVFVVCALVGESAEVLIVLGLSWFAAFLITMVSARIDRVDIGIQLIGAILMYLILPVGFFFGGGVNGGSANWFIFIFIYFCLMMSGRGRIAFIITGVIVTGGCYLLADTHPELVTGHTDDMAYLDSFASVVLLSVLICVMFLFQRRAFEDQNRLAEEQKKEIIELNERQNHFFSSMSHEIRTPINTIIGLNEMTLREDISDEVAENSLNIQGASRILLSLINDILDMSKIESGQMTIVDAPYDVGGMLSEIVNMIWSQAKEKGLAFHVDIDPSLPSEMVGDEVRIKQVMINILNNAVKYTEEGSVSLSVQCKKKGDKRISVSYSVKDTGSGIKRESIPYLFSAFRRMDEERTRYIEGTGLGLSIVKQLVELMDGEIAVDSIYTKGSTFVVTLEQGIENETAIGELNLAQHRLNDRRKAYAKSFEAPKAKVLVVDDNEVNLLVAKKLLRETGMQVETVTNGEDCLQKTMFVHYDMIFMDHLMPGMDGVECLHALRAQVGGLNTETPVVVLTANAGSDVVAMYEREGFDDCLLKPVTGELLEEAALKFLPPELVSVTVENQIVETESLVRKGLRKRPVRITTESVCDLPEKVLERQEVSILPCLVHTEGGVFQDGVEIGANAAITYIEKLGKNAWASEPDVPDYIGFFARELEQAQNVIHIAAGKGASGAYPKAMAASQTFGNVTVINSAQMSSGLGFLVLRASQMAEQGMPAREIVENIEKMRTQIRTTFLLDSTKYLKRNGRIPKRANIICEAFLLHPCVAMTDRGMQMQKLYPGKRSTAWRHYIAEKLRDAAHIDTRLLFIAYSGLSIKDIEEIEEQVNRRLPFERIIRQRVTPSSTTMFGPGTFGLIYATKERY